MTDTPTKIVVNCSTGEREVLPLTAEEIAEREAITAQAEVERLEQEAADLAKAEAKESAVSKLAALGLSPEEIAAITGA